MLKVESSGHKEGGLLRAELILELLDIPNGVWMVLHSDPHSEDAPKFYRTRKVFVCKTTKKAGSIEGY